MSISLDNGAGFVLSCSGTWIRNFGRLLVEAVDVSGVGIGGVL